MSRADEAIALARQALAIAATEQGEATAGPLFTPRSAALYLRSRLENPSGPEELQELGFAFGVLMEARDAFMSRISPLEGEAAPTAEAPADTSEETTYATDLDPEPDINNEPETKGGPE